MTFSWGQLFRDNRYSGADRQTDANQLTLALTTPPDPPGRRPREAVGQHRPDPLLRRHPGDHRRRTPGRAAASRPGSPTSTVAQRPLDHRRRLPVGPEVPPRGPGQPARPLPDARRRRGQPRLPLPPRPAGTGRLLLPVPDQRVLERGRPLLLLAARQRQAAGSHRRRAMGQLLPGRAPGRRAATCATARATSTTRCRLEFELKGLGSAGQNTERTLRRAILGYNRDDLYLVAAAATTTPRPCRQRIPNRSP